MTIRTIDNEGVCGIPGLLRRLRDPAVADERDDRYLVDAGAEVDILTETDLVQTDPRLGPLQDLYLTRQRLARKGVTSTTDIAVLEIQGRVVKGLNVYSNEMMDFEGYNTIVLAAGNVSQDNLYFELKCKVKELYRIGDCVAPRKTDMAIVEGHRVGRVL